MNSSGFADDDDHNASNRSFLPSHDNYNTDSTIGHFYVIIWYVVLTLGLPGNVLSSWQREGVPGNVLSAIVWLRHPVASNNSSAVYLAALAIEDLAFLMFGAIFIFICTDDNWLYGLG